MPIIERLFQYIDFKKDNPSNFERTLGIANGLLGKKRTTSGGIGSGIIEKILTHHSDLNPEWLLLGSGPMIKETNDSNINQIAINGNNHLIKGSGDITTENQDNSLESINRELSKRVEQLEIEINHLQDKLSMKDEIITLLRQRLNDL